LRENNICLPGTDRAIEIARIYAVKSSIERCWQALMQKCIDFAMLKKHHTIWLGVWEHNQRAIDFYTRWGFEKFAEHDFILGNDVQKDWLMKKLLLSISGIFSSRLMFPWVISEKDNQM
jgi:hypothetical protein